MAYNIDVLKDDKGNIIRPATITDNVVNPNSGKSVTDELNQLSQKLEGQEKNYIEGKRLLSSYGVEVDDDNWFVTTDYIPVKNGDTIVWNPGLIQANACLAIYGQNKNYIEYWSANALQRTITITDSISAYIRASFAISSKASANIIINNVSVWKPKEKIESGFIASNIKLEHIDNIRSANVQDAIQELSNNVLPKNYEEEEGYWYYDSANKLKPLFVTKGGYIAATPIEINGKVGDVFVWNYANNRKPYYTLFIVFEMNDGSFDYYLSNSTSGSRTITTTFEYVRIWVSFTTDGDGFKPLLTRNGNVLWEKNDGGALSKQINALTDNVKELNEKVGDQVPVYWKEHLSAKELKIQQEVESAKSDSFVFITDMHYPSNHGVSPSLIKDIVNKTSVKKIVFGGDIINTENTSEYAAQRIRDLKNNFKGFDFVGIVGNHDDNMNGQPLSSEDVLKVSDSALYANYITPNEDKFVTNGELHFYRDIQNIKMRYIFLDSGRGLDGNQIIKSEQIEWMKQRLLELEEGWHAVVIAHHMWEDETRKHDSGNLILAGINSIYNSLRCTFFGVISGHTHMDLSEKTSNGYWLIATVCDANQSVTHTKGTISEQAFDVFVFDLENNKINATRIGSIGLDRTFAL